MTLFTYLDEDEHGWIWGIFYLCLILAFFLTLFCAGKFINPLIIPYNCVEKCIYL